MVRAAWRTQSFRFHPAAIGDYIKRVLFLLRCMTMFLLITGLVSPIAELFDHWDPPGLGNDTEMPLFAFVLMLSLILLVCRLLASVATTVTLIITCRFSPRVPSFQLWSFGIFRAFQQPAFFPSSPPLRI